MTPGFRSKLEFEDDGGFPFILLAPLVFDSDVLHTRITVPAGFKTDLASIPQVLENILPRIGAYDAAAVVHDLLYQQGTLLGQPIARSQADAVLREGMDVCGVSAWKRWAIYAGVRVGGWVVWRKYRKDVTPKVGPLAAAALLLCLLPTLASAQGNGAAVIAGTFHGCPVAGKTKVAAIRALNVLKNRADAPRSTNAAVTLDALVAPGADLGRWSTDDGAEIQGYIVDVVPGGIESVNCGTKILRYRDTHIFIGPTAGTAKKHCIVVEVTPRFREAIGAVGGDWSTAALKKMTGQHVQVRGWLFADSEHKQNAVNTNPKGRQLWRATVWEVHPVTAITVVP